VADLEPAAWEAVRDNRSALVVAGPGAGKTELLAQRASYLLETGLCASPHRILAISFKRDAARNLRERVTLRCGMELARRFDSYTFDAWAKSLLDRFRLALPEDYRPTADYAIDFQFAYERPLRERLLSICERAGVAAGQIQALDVAQFFRRAITGRAIALGATPQPGSRLALAQALWQSALHSGVRSALPFPMIGALAELLLRTNPPLLAALRATYHFAFLDEFQDTTAVQYRLVLTALQGSPAILTAVGDHKQRIMLWADAQVGVFDAFTNDFGAIRRGLIMNYRSAPRLVAIQQHLIAALDPQSPAPRAADDGSAGEGECRVLVFPNDEVEARHVAALISRWVGQDGIRPSEICVLARQQLDRYTENLRAELAQLGIRSRVQNELQDLLAEPLTTVAVDALRLCVAPRAPESWQALCQVIIQLRGADDSEVEARQAISGLTDFIGGLRPRLAAATTADQLTGLIRELLGFLDEPTFRRLHPQYMQTEFFSMTIEACARNLADARARNADWPSALDDFLGVDCVPMMSIHKSKGLEFHTVVFLGLEDYPFRSIRSGDGEEECNFFVAFSRAKKRVVFTFADTRSARTQSRTGVRRFYELLERAGVVVEEIG
jgi:superfamily I DNA/RNA helicase